MRAINMGYFNEISFHIGRSYRRFITSPLYILSSLFVDLLFFLLFGVAYSYLGGAITENLVEINGIITRLNADLGAVSSGTADETLLASILGQKAALMGYMKSIALLAALMILITYLLWCVFQGINWHLASWVSHQKKTSFIDYLRKFSLLNLAWLALSLLAVYITYRLSIYNAMSRVMLVSQGAINYLMLLLLLAVFYFAAISYMFASKKGTVESLKMSFVWGIKKFHIYAPVFGLSAAKLVIVYLFIIFLNIGFFFAVMLNVLLMIPILAWGRLSLHEVGKHGNLLGDAVVQNRAKAGRSAG